MTFRNAPEKYAMHLNAKIIELPFDNIVIPVSVMSDNRKRLKVKVYPDMSVIAKAPLEYTQEEIFNCLIRMASWIDRKLGYFKKLQPVLLNNQYMDGKPLYYLGEKYRLSICSGSEVDIQVTETSFQVMLPNLEDRQKTEKLIQKWYANQAKQICEHRIAFYFSEFFQRGVRKPEIRYRCMKKRWGTCYSKGLVLLNTELVKTPVFCIDYVIVHEFCHLLCSRHDRHFYRLLTEIMPDWKYREEQIKRFIVMEKGA